MTEMESPKRKMQKKNDYQRHKLFRKIKRRRKALAQADLEVAEKLLKRKLKLPKFGDGKEIVNLDNAHFDKDGNLVDNTTGVSYTPILNDVVITPNTKYFYDPYASAKNYYDPNTTMEFINAAIAPISNFSPSNVIGSLRKASGYHSFINSFMNQDNNGFFTDNFAKLHPMLTMVGNLVGDMAIGAAVSKGFNFLRSSLADAKYSKRGYTKLAERYIKKGDLDDSTLDGVYNYFYKNGDTEMLQKLRDAHFKIKADNPLLNDNGNPLQLYHTVGDRFNPNFHEFNTNIEGRPTAIYTTDGLDMSRSYSTRINNTLESAKRNLKLHKHKLKAELKEYEKYKKALLDNDEYIINTAYYPNVHGREAVKKLMEANLLRADHHRNHIINNKNYDPSNIKRLYSNAKKSTSLNGLGRNWNALPITEDPNLRPFVNGRLSTRGYEAAIRAHTDYDRMVINNIMDYGAGVNAGSHTPYTVVENFNPSDLKYSDAVTYDNAGKVIPLSQRDNFNLPDLRYSLVPLGVGAAYSLLYK